MVGFCYCIRVLSHQGTTVLCPDITPAIVDNIANLIHFMGRFTRSGYDPERANSRILLLYPCIVSSKHRGIMT